MPRSNQSKWITANDLDRSATAHMLDDTYRALHRINGTSLARLLDIGCGFGGLTRLVGEHLGISELYGIDLDAEALKEAQSKGVVTCHLDVGREPLPFPEEHFDLVMSFGMLDYLPFYDPFLREVHRVLRPGGMVLISLPNLASWHNRLFFLLGYQPRDVEVSREKLVGVHPWYRRDDKPTGHIHTITVPAMEELMGHHGFTRLAILGARPRGRHSGAVARAVDRLFTLRPTLARRFFYLGVRTDARNGNGQDA